MVHGVAVNNYQLHGSAQLKDPLYLGLDLGEVVSPGARLLQNGPFRRIVQHGFLAQRDIRRDPGDDDATLELVFQELKHSFLHHVRDLVALERWTHQDERPDAGDDVVGRQGLLFLAQQSFLLLYDWRGGHPDSAPLPVVSVQAARGRTGALAGHVLDVARTE